MPMQEVTWSGILDIRSVGGLRAELDHILVQGMDVLIDFSAVERVDTAVSQLLFSFKQTINMQSHQLIIRSVPEHVREGWMLLGLVHLIESEPPSSFVELDKVI
ncbi:MAG: STAS domain-containing protein [Pseudomonadales bacterium]|nr:STAS domain-containing protein [Pseudomonadales bacterium]